MDIDIIARGMAGAAKESILADYSELSSDVSGLKEDLADIENGNKTVDSSLNISEKKYGLYAQNTKEWTPSNSGSFARMTDTKTLINGNKYLGIAKCNVLSYFNNFGLLINGSWYKSSLGGFKTIPTEKLAYCYLTPDKDDIIPAIIVGNEGVGNSCLAECYVYDITDYDGTVTSNFVLKVFNKSYEKYSYEDIKNIANRDTWYKGKVLTCLGDSWTAQDTFRTRLQNYFGFSRVNNCSIGGTRLTGSGSTAFASDDRINTIPLDTDALTILGGANDAVYGTIGGGQINFDTTDLNSASGALNVILSKIYYKFRMTEDGFYSDIDYSGITRVAERKDIKIFIATCCGRYDGDNYAKYARMISDGARNIANLHGLPVIDLAYESGINDMNYPSYLGDNVHPNDIGDILVSNVFINTFLGNEPHD